VGDRERVTVYVDGDVVGLAEARIPVTDRGLAWGDGVFEVLRTANGRPFLLERHLERLNAAASAIQLEPPDDGTITLAVSRCISEHAGDVKIRIMVTRGDAPLGTRFHAAGPCRLIVVAEPLRLPPPEVYERGIALLTVGRRVLPIAALDPRIKTLAYLDRVLALEAALQAGADEAIRLDALDRVAECATANLFYITNGTLMTPPAITARPGVTREVVLESAHENRLSVQEHSPTLAELADADEVFVTSAVRGVMPVRSIDGASRSVGPLTRKLIAHYLARLAQA